MEEEPGVLNPFPSLSLGFLLCQQGCQEHPSPWGLRGMDEVTKMDQSCPCNHTQQDPEAGSPTGGDLTCTPLRPRSSLLPWGYALPTLHSAPETEAQRGSSLPGPPRGAAPSLLPELTGPAGS